MLLNKVKKIFLEKFVYCKNDEILFKIFLRTGSMYTLDPIDENETTFEKILIANRGEIACRVINTAHKMGIKTVAIYSIADAHSKHVKLADEAIFIGPSAASESYLSISKIMDAIKQTGADAVHPGYGFLSENATFVGLLEKENVVFIGPSASAITGMGDKLESKRLAMAAGVNTIPGFDGIVKDAEQCAEIARNIGYPVMIKASAGGGGKGMRIARNNNDIKEGFKLCLQEALSSFGDNRMLVEKFIENPRHIEIQVLGDKYGNVIYLNERECSIQRRNQKVIEESPSLFLDDVTRKAMGEQSIALCKLMSYSSAGTVEFLVDESRNFYFLEMNTRLQVEHPVTECTTGIDLVHQMIRLAKGHKLKLKQSDIRSNRWAVECRIYAEDPFKNLGLPNVGRLHKYVEPVCINGVRCDSGVEEGSEISFYYDSMISKLIGYGKDRVEAIRNCLGALDSYVIRGVKNNISLLRDVLSHEKFHKGDINTNYLNDVYPDGFKGAELSDIEENKLLAIGTALYATNDLRNRKITNGPQFRIHAKILDNWELSVNLNQKNFVVQVFQLNGQFVCKINGNKFEIDKKELVLAKDLMKIKLNTEIITVQLLSKNSSGEYEIIYKGTNFKLNILSKSAADLLYLMPVKPQPDISKQIRSPMPGLVKTVACFVGDFVTDGQELCTIEAMKMQNSMLATTSGKIKLINIRPNVTVGEHDILIELE